MNVTLGQIRTAIESGALSKLATEPLPIKQAYWVGRIAEAAETEYRRIEKHRIELVKAHGTQTDDQWQVPPEKNEIFQADFATLLLESVELPSNGFTLDELGDIKLSGLDFLNLAFLIRHDAA